MDFCNAKKASLWGEPLPRLRAVFKERGLPTYSADQIYHWAFRRGVFEWEKWTNISKKSKSLIQEKFNLFIPKVIKDTHARDHTRKFLVQMQDGQAVETVLIPAKNRMTLCLSSQVGCALGCVFCATGTMGLKRHLVSGEIVGQWMAVIQWIKSQGLQINWPTNLVYMGEGEPLHNFDQVKWATEVFMEDRGHSFSQRKITLSTSGLAPEIEKLAQFPPVNIALSLHATRNSLRSKLMPINKTYNLGRVLKAVQKIPLKAHRKITYEYLLIKDINDGPEDIKGLTQLLDRKNSKINLIPFNEFPGSPLKRPPEEKIHWFQSELLKCGLTCTVRIPRGQNISAACGQLRN